MIDYPWWTEVISIEWKFWKEIKDNNQTIRYKVNFNRLDKEAIKYVDYYDYGV